VLLPLAVVALEVIVQMAAAALVVGVAVLDTRIIFRLLRELHTQLL